MTEPTAIEIKNKSFFAGQFFSFLTACRAAKTPGATVMDVVDALRLEMYKNGSKGEPNANSNGSAQHK